MLPRTHRSQHHRFSGFTLIEVLVVLVLLGLVMASAIRGARSFAKSDLRGASGRMAGAIRYLFDRAATTGRVHRLVIDFEAGKYWAEASDDEYLLPREKETEEARAIAREELQKAIDEKEKRGQSGQEAAAAAKAEEEADPDSTKGGGVGFGFGASATGSQRYSVDRYLPKEYKRKKSRFEMFRETAVKPVEVKKVKLAGLYTPRLSDTMSTGTGYLYFFPLGFAEPAILHLTDDKRAYTYSLVVHPLTGRVKIYDKFVAPPVEQQYDDEGTLIE